MGSTILFSQALLGQTTEEDHIKLNGLHEKVMSNAAQIRDGQEDDKDLHTKSAEEAGKAIERAKIEHMEMKKHVPEHKKAMAMTHHRIIESHHEQAQIHHDALKAELAKEKYDIKLARQHSANLHESIKKAELEHQKLKDKLDD